MLEIDTFEYKDSELGDSKSIVIRTGPDVFYPTSTSILLLRAIREFINKSGNIDNLSMSILDLGCGSGIIATVLSKHLSGDHSFFASDICEKAVGLTKYNADSNKVKIDCRYGSLFEPWDSMKFNVIVSDVPGVSEPIARISKWYPSQINCDTGIDGTRLIVSVIEQAPNFLMPGGCIFFPVLTLSHERTIIEKAHAFFKKIELLEEQWFPFDSDIMSKFEVIEKIAKKHIIQIRKRGSRWLWTTRIYAAMNCDAF